MFKRGVWLGTLALSVGGWMARLDAQAPVAWHLAGQQTTPVTLTGSELLPCPGGPSVTIGRPIASAPAQPIPPAAPGLPPLTPVTYQTPVELPPTEHTLPPPLPTWTDETEAPPDQSALIEQVSLFASDRAGPAAAGPAEILRAGAGPAAAGPGEILRVEGQVEKLPVGPPAPTNTPKTSDLIDTMPAQMGVELVSREAAGLPANGPLPDPLHCHYWVEGEYLLWTIKSYHVPPLVSTGTPVFDATGNPAGIAAPMPLFGDSNLGGGLRSGFRLTAGFWGDMWQEEGAEISGFYLGNKDTSFFTSTAQNPVIVRPFFQVNNPPHESFEIISFPNLQTGSVSITSHGSLFGIEPDYRAKLCCGCDYRVDLLAGFRFLDLDEDLNITEVEEFSQSPVLGPARNQGDLRGQTGTAVDDFHTKNRFYGGQLGIAAEKSWGAWSLEAKAKLGLGVTSQEVIINGSQSFVPNSGLNAVGGLLALPSNIGSHATARFSVVPEIDLNVGYQVTEHMRALIGYNFLYWTEVVRPGDQIDHNLDVTTIPNFALLRGEQPTGLGRPAVPIKESGFWAQGLNVGVEFRY